MRGLLVSMFFFYCSVLLASGGGSGVRVPDPKPAPAPKILTECEKRQIDLIEILEKTSGCKLMPSKQESKTYELFQCNFNNSGMVLNRVRVPKSQLIEVSETMFQDSAVMKEIVLKSTRRSNDCTDTETAEQKLDKKTN